MKIGALVILYNPTEENIANIVNCLEKQVDKICMVDNSDKDNSHLLSIDEKIIYFPLCQNVGIARAQNKGIKYFIEHHFDYIISCDQDTTIGQDVVKRLLSTTLQLKSQNINVGAVAPIGIDHNTQKPLSYSTPKIKDITIGNLNLMEVYQTMNSMSLISVDLFEKVGLMDETLFIDGVDCEWCWRAKHLLDARFFYDYNIKMNHTLGISTKKIGGREIHITPSFRMYYQYRNFIWLAQRNYTPKRWIIRNGIKYIFKIFYYTIKSTNRRSYIKNILKGIRDGISSQTKN